MNIALRTTVDALIAALRRAGNVAADRHVRALAESAARDNDRSSGETAARDAEVRPS